MRIQSFEFGDISSIPKCYHNYLRSLMSLLYEYFKIHKLWIPVIRDFYQSIHSEVIMDPCAGSGHVNFLLEKEFRDEKEIKFILSDFMTNRAPMFSKKINEHRNPRLKYVEKSVDVLNMKEDELKIPKMFINSFHHFNKEQVSKILSSHARTGTDVLVLEYCRKTFLNFVSIFLGPIIGMLLFPFIVKKEDFLLSFLFVFIISIIPIMLLWDGIVSSLRTYGASDIREILTSAGIKNFTVDSYQKRSILYPSGVTAITIKFQEN